MRWTGSMVADIHRILLRGGVFLYPWDARQSGQSSKLRLLCEDNPMAMLVEQAGGLAHSGTLPILDHQPSSLHERIGVILGSRNDVEKISAYYAGQP
jgi:fructose-1,6-bisphosphatase I